MSEVLYTGTLSAQQLTQLIADCTFSQDARFLGEQLPTHIVDNTERQNLLLFDWYSSAIAFASYDTGRIFQRSGELRWERSANQFLIVYLGSDQPAAALDRHACIKEKDFTTDQYLQPPGKQYFLFGTFLDKVKVSENRLPYAEARIPRILYYPLNMQQEKQRIEKQQSKPVDQLKRLGISTVEYRDTESGQIIAYRFQSLDVMEFTTTKKGA